MFEDYSYQYKMEACSICCERKKRGLTQLDKLRPSQICYDCWYQHISNVVLRMSYKVGDNVLSPFHSQPSIDIINCLNSLHPSHSAQIQETLFRKYNSFTKDIEKCPAQVCDYVYVGGGKCKWRNKDNVYQCPKCNSPLTVNQNAFKNLTATIYFLFSNRCPKCEIPIQKISGCPHMTCPCGHHFCWYCYKDHPSGGFIDRVYSIHTIPECSFIFISKILLFLIGISSILISSSGSSTIDYVSSMLSVVFSVLMRTIFIDGLILLEVMIVMMMKKNRNIIRIHNDRNNQKFIMGIIIVNILIIIALQLLDELTYCLFILLGEIVFTVVCFGIGYGIVFSIETWFQFIA